MRIKDIDGHQVLKSIDLIAKDSFHTKDLSERPEMLGAHGLSDGNPSYNGAVGRYLSKHEYGLGLRRDPNWVDSNMLWRKRASRPEEDQPRAEPKPRPPLKAEVSGGPVRPGHWASLEYMTTPSFREIKEHMDQVPDFGGVYFRPTDRGLTMLDLHPKSLKPRIGIGQDPNLRAGATWTELEPSILERCSYLEGVRNRQEKPARENQFEARLIRGAQENHLILPGFPERLRYINSQWRIDDVLGQAQEFTDLLAVDLVSQALVLIELKAEPDDSALSQVQSYLSFFSEEASELNPFFLRLAQVMGSLYSCPELEKLSLLEAARVGLTAWPTVSDEIYITGLEKL